MCKVLKVNRASYYHWLSSGSVVRKVDIKLNELVEFIFNQGRNAYGTRRIKDKLLLYYGLFVSRKRISNIMKNLREPLIINYQEHFSNLSRNFS